jgi:hypothetical protein
MLIESTINVHKNIMEMLEKSSEATGRTRTHIIKILMQRIMKDNHKLFKMNSRVKYQERDLKENWHRLHIVMNEYEYDYCLDMRKLFKMSVSFILAFAVKRFLDEVMNRLLDMHKNTDNYRYRNYLLIKKIIDGIICWQIYWGIPEKLPDITTV